jgi:phosphomannomutase
MPEELIISISGMRGIIGENLTADIAAQYGAAFGTFLKNRNQTNDKLSVCIGADSRPSGQMIFSAVAAGLCSVGIDVIDLGVVTTPGAGIMTVNLNCAGGVVITASHNPIQYNGIKLLLDDGIAPAPDIAEDIRQRYFDKKFDYVQSINCGKISDCENTDSIHIAKVLGIINPKKIAENCFKVVLDSVNGAGGRAGKKLLDQLDCRVKAINYEPTGIFAHTPEPTKENLTELCDEVKKEGAAIGFAQDPDADRLAIVDENGNYIGEEYTLALAAKYMFEKNNNATAATNLSTSRMIDDIAENAGGKVIRTAVGEANVAKSMKENNCVIGGEGNGGVIDLRVGPIRNSLVAMAMVLELMARTGKTVSQLIADIPLYCMIKDKFNADKTQAQKLLKEVSTLFPDAKINDIDGVRFDFDDGWLHLRTSNTEPIMRAIVEANTEEKAKAYLQKVLEVRDKLFN